MERDIILEWWYPQTSEQVWECLTNAELLGEWLMKNDFKPIVGHKFQFRTTPKPAFKWNGIVYGTVMEVVPFKRICYKWQSGPEPGVVTMDTTVTWMLEEEKGGTRLKLEHKGFRGMKNYFASLIMEKGWKKHGSNKFVKMLESVSHGQI